MKTLSSLKAAWALALVNIKSFPQRIMSSSITMLSIACVAAVMLSVLAMTEGMIKTLSQTGLDNTVLVMRAGANSEIQSVLFPMEVNLLKNHQQVLRDKNQQAIVSAEMFVNAEYKHALLNENDVGESLALRGVSNNTYLFRPNFALISGRKFTPGLRELTIGQAIARRMPELTVGSSMTLGGAQWLIVGIFADNNSVFESELWADLGVVQSDYQRGTSVQSVRLAMKARTNLKAIDQQWQEDPRLNVRVIAEKQFFAEQGENLTRLIRWIGIPVAVVMAIGAVIAALNTMYAAIAARSKEIATQKAIGFAPSAISCAIISEAILLAIAGALLGIVPIYLLFDGWTAATQDANNLSQMMFNFDINARLILITLTGATVIGLIGGLLPAIKAMKLPVTLALRDS